MEKMLFSTVLYVDSAEKLPLALENLKAQGLEKNSLQLIVIDPSEEESVKTLCAKRTDTIYLSAPHAEIGEAYEMGLSRAEGKYINFTLASSTYTEGTYQHVKEHFRRTDYAVSVNPFQFHTDTGLTHYKGAYNSAKGNTIVNLKNNNGRIQLMLQAYFFRDEVVKQFHFQPQLHDDAVYCFLLELQMEYPIYHFLSKKQYIYTVTREDDISANPLQHQKWWYQPAMENFFIPFLTKAKKRYGVIPKFVQFACYYLIYCRYNCNKEDRNKGVLTTKQDVLDFTDASFRALALLDAETVATNKLTPYFHALRYLRVLLLRGRAKVMGRGCEVSERIGRFCLDFPLLEGEEAYTPSLPFVETHEEKLNISIMNYNEGFLQIDASVGLSEFLDREDYEVFTTVNANGEKQTYPAEDCAVYPLLKFFGVTMSRKHPVLFKIPVSDSRMRINFFYRFKGHVYPMNITFVSATSRLNAKNPYSYWLFGKDRVLTWKDNSTIIVAKNNPIFHFKREILFSREAYRICNDKTVAKRGLCVRWLYWLLLPFYKNKHLWVTFDKLYKAGDNGEYMYQYLRKNAKDVEPYYIIKRDSPDYPRMVQQDKKHILVFDTVRTQVIALMAEIYMGTHVNITAQYNPSADYLPFTKDLQRGDYVCIQHGLTIQKIAQFQSRYFDNIHLYCLASPYELKNLSHPFYDYQPEQLKMTGLARYDGLKSNDQKVILITPTWRKNVVNSNVANTKKTHNDNFKNSKYFRIYNNLINDTTLIECAKRNGYRITYLLHPAMSAQLEDFDQNGFVELVAATSGMNYEKVLTEASLMVTDYSGVQFDFAYMRKPIVYYHPNELPPHYDAGGLIYETMGFGPIARTHEQIVSELCAAMERQCVNDAEYIRRADDFFAFSDHNNCERIYKAIKDFTNAR